MIQSLIYDLLAFTCWLYAMYRGGPPERIGASVLLVGSALTYIAVSAPASRFASVEMGVLAVDTLALIAFLALALAAERWWPLWIAALQTIGTAAHAAKMVDPTVIPWAYAFALAFWSYPMLLLLAWGTWNYQRRLAKFGVDKSWSTFSGRSVRRRQGGPIA